MKTIAALILLFAALAQGQMNQPVRTASAIVTLNVTNVVVTNWNVPNAFAGVGAKLKLIREEGTAKYGTLNLIATNIVENPAGTWKLWMSKTNIDGRNILYHHTNSPASDILKEPFGFSIYVYFLAYGIEVTGGVIDLEVNGITNSYAIPSQTIPGNQIFVSRLDKTSAHSRRPIWQHMSKP